MKISLLNKIVFWLAGIIIGPPLALFLFLLFLTGPYSSWVHLRKAIPDQIETGRVIAYGDETPWIQLRYEGCGAVVYKLSKKTADEIKEKGLSFFHDGMISTTYAGSKNAYYYTWREWKESPIPRNSNGAHPGIHCMFKNEKSKLKSEIFDAMRAKGSFYSYKDEAIMYVLPELEMVVFAYYG